MADKIVTGLKGKAAVSGEAVCGLKNLSTDEMDRFDVVPTEKRAIYARARFDDLVAQHREIVKGCALEPRLLAVDVAKEKWEVEQRLATLIAKSAHAAFHAIETLNSGIVSLKLGSDVLADYKGETQIVAEKGETLAHLAAIYHPELAVYLLSGTGQTVELNDFKKRILGLQDEKGVKVREVCIFSVRGFLADIDKKLIERNARMLRKAQSVSLSL